MPSCRLLAIVPVLVSLVPAAARAQDFRIYTRVLLAPDSAAAANTETAGTDAARPEIIARSLTLFHAGRVYDYVDAAGEVIVLEPAHRRFTILSTSRNLSTTVDFEELNNLLKVARHETESYLEKLDAEESAASQAAARQLRFQMDPTFEESFDAPRRTLTLSSRMLRYQARCADDAAPEVIDAWAKYADAMCRLNFVLHPSAVLPESRLALNASLAQRRLVPTAVELVVDVQPRLHLRAEHEMTFDLDARDRSLIHHWESVLKRKTTKSVTFREYQKQVATTRTAARK